MSKRKEHIEWELSILKIGLNSRYGINKDDNWEERQQKISNRIVELKEELKALNQNKDEIEDRTADIDEDMPGEFVKIKEENQNKEDG